MNFWKIINWLFINSIIYEKRESNFTNFEISKILQYKFKCMQFEKIISRKKILTSMKFLNIEIVWIFGMQFTIDHSICTKDWICTLTNPSDQWKQKCYALKQFFQRFLVRNNKLKDCNMSVTMTIIYLFSAMNTYNVIHSFSS